MKYGFLGLGIMGSGMAHNLVRAGFDVTVWNRSVAKCASFVAEGAKSAATPAEVVAACDITFAIVSDPHAAEAVFFGADGAGQSIAPGHDYVDCSTVDDTTTKRIAAAVAAKGGRFLEAPVSGTKKPAADGTLIFLTAGDESLYHDAAPALDRMGKKRVYLGAPGQGARMKLIVNMVMGSMMAVLGEGLALGNKSGLDGATILDVLDAGAMACPLFKNKGPLVLGDDYPTSFPLKHQQKDLRLVAALARDLGQTLVAGNAAHDLYTKALVAGLGDADMSAVAEVTR